MKAARVCLVVCFALLLASCSLKPGWDLVGKWQKEGSTETIEFLRNGSLNLVSGETSLTTPYRFNDPKRLKIEIGSLGTFVLKIAVAGDTLTLTDPSGQVTKFKKMK